MVTKNKNYAPPINPDQSHVPFAAQRVLVVVVNLAKLRSES